MICEPAPLYLLIGFVPIVLMSILFVREALRARAFWRKCNEAHDALMSAARCDDLRVAIHEAAKVIETHAEHWDDCPVSYSEEFLAGRHPECNCGLDRVRALLERRAPAQK